MDQNIPSLSSGENSIQHQAYNPASQNRTTWALILDKREAHFFEKEGRRFNPVRIMENLQLVYDGLSNDTIGRGSSMGDGRHKYEPTMTESRQNTIAFAKEIVSWLDTERRSGHFDDVVIAASPAMLGEVMKNIAVHALGKCVIGTASKNMMELSGRELEEQLLKLIPGPAKT